MSFSDRLSQDQEKWNNLSCKDKDIIPSSIDEIDRWVQKIANCMKSSPKNSDQIGPDSFSRGKKISTLFGILKDGELMDALSNNNDCLIHSFLTCVSPIFRKFEKDTRHHIAGYFRRFILSKIPNIPNDVKDRLLSYRFLTTGELIHISKHFKIPIIIIQDGPTPITRNIEIFPSLDDNFWNDKSNAEFILIHGDNSHFTPIKYDKEYIKTLTYNSVQKINGEITAEMASYLTSESDITRKLNLVTQGFIDIIKDDIEIMKKEVDNIKNNTDYSKSLKMSSIIEIFKISEDKYLDNILHNKLITEDLKDKASALIHDALITELISSKSKDNKNQLRKIKDLEKEYGHSRMSYENALSKAIEISLVESKNNVVKPATENSTILRSMSMKARIGNGPETQYRATVHKPAPSNAKGGKRNTKKAKRVKKHNTKKTKRMRN